jgi:hypothetical protein
VKCRFAHSLVGGANERWNEPDDLSGNAVTNAKISAKSSQNLEKSLSLIFSGGSISLSPAPEYLATKLAHRPEMFYSKVSRSNPQFAKAIVERDCVTGIHKIKNSGGV